MSQDVANYWFLDTPNSALYLTFFPQLASWAGEMEKLSAQTEMYQLENKKNT